MANYSKAFNFRGGFQVDTDVLLVRGSNVGIGSTIPQERLDVDGTIFTRALRIEADEVRGDITQIDKANVGVLSVSDDLYVGVGSTGTLQYFPFIRPAVRISTGIITSAQPNLGVVTYYGDGGRLLNLPTSQWLDVDPGIGFTSIYAQGSVGVGTTMPVYKFQVDGSPFPREFGGMSVGFQTGIGMEKGNIYASGIVSTRGEFSGIGSLITNMDARNLGIGTIPVARYGPLIVTEVVRANYFIGTATTAIGVRTDSDLIFDTGLARELEVTSRFISSEGKLQIGDISYFDAQSDAGDIDVYKDGTATAYVMSENDSSRIFVGKERNFSTQRRFGGLRFGGDAQDPDSQENDLDIVNYDIGNVNLYLHSGSGNINSTIGEFRFIYGKTDRILTTLNKNGRFRINANSSATEPSLDVVGFGTFRDDLYVAGDYYLVGDGKTQGDFEIGGRLILKDATLAGATFTGDIQVGDDPTSGVGDGVGIGTSGGVTASSEIVVWGTGGPAVSADTNGDITMIGNLNADGSGTFNLVNSNIIELNSSMIGPDNFSLGVSGLAVDNAAFDTLRAVGGVLSLRTPIEYYNLGITSTTITVDNIIVGESIIGNFDITANNITILGGIAVSGTTTTTDLNVTGITSTNTLFSSTSTLGVAQADSMSIDSTLTVATINVSDVNATTNVATQNLQTITADIGQVTNSPVFNNDVDIDGTANIFDVQATTLSATSATLQSLTVGSIANPSVTFQDIQTETIGISSQLTSSNATFTGNTQIQQATIATIAGDTNCTGEITAVGLDASGDVSGSTGTFGTLSAANLSVTNAVTTLNVSNLTADTANINTLAGTNGNVNALTVTDLVITGTLSGNYTQADPPAFSELTVGDLTATDVIATNVSAQSLDVADYGDIVGQSVGLSSGITSVDGAFTGTLTAATLSATNGTVVDLTITDSISIGGTFTSTNADITNLDVGDVTANTIAVTQLQANAISPRSASRVTISNFTSPTGQVDDLTVTDLSADDIVTDTIQVGPGGLIRDGVGISPLEIDGGDLILQVFENGAVVGTVAINIDAVGT